MAHFVGILMNFRQLDGAPCDLIAKGGNLDDLPLR